MRGWGLALGTALVALVAADRLLGRYGSKHFLPEQQMRAAIAGGDGCVLFLGDSRMVSALDKEAFQAALREHSADRCVTDLAIGATDVSGAFIAARTYLASGRTPAITVVGKVEDSLLDPDATRPHALVGNNALHLVWSTPGDVFAQVPGFPFASVAAFDDGLRFLLARALSLGRYQSLVSFRVQRWQDGLTGSVLPADNRFGLAGDMAALEHDLRARAKARLALAVKHPGARSLWFDPLLDLLETHGSRVVVVELPMPRSYREGVSQSPEALLYRQSFSTALSARGHAYVDLSHPPWLDDSAFMDALHLGRQAAAQLSRDLGSRIGTNDLAGPAP
jgi:hypothetical protein